MDSKFLIILGLLVAFFIGSGTSGLTSRAFNVPDQDAIAAEVSQKPTPLAVPSVAAPRAVPTSLVRDEAPAPVKKKRTLQKEALIVGGGAGAGAAVGAVAGGKKGAAIGAVSGGIAGLIYDLATRNK